jgi:hypothetical protein
MKTAAWLNQAAVALTPPAKLPILSTRHLNPGHSHQKDPEFCEIHDSSNAESGILFCAWA